MSWLRVFQIAPGEQFSQSHDTCSFDDKLLPPLREIECLDMDERRVCGGQSSQIRGHVDGIESLFIRGRLLTDIPFQCRQRQVRTTLRDGGLQPLGGIAPIRKW